MSDLDVVTLEINLFFSNLKSKGFTPDELQKMYADFLEMDKNTPTEDCGTWN